MEHTPVGPEQFAGLADVDDWRHVGAAICAEFSVGSFAEAGALVSSIARAADEVDHHPDVDLRYPDRVRIALTSHDVGGLTHRDVELARIISTLAAGAGATACRQPPGGEGAAPDGQQGP